MISLIYENHTSDNKIASIFDFLPTLPTQTGIEDGFLCYENENISWGRVIYPVPDVSTRELVNQSKHKPYIYNTIEVFSNNIIQQNLPISFIKHKPEDDRLFVRTLHNQNEKIDYDSQNSRFKQIILANTTVLYRLTNK